MKPPSIRTYMSTAIAIAIADHKGAPIDHLAQDLLDAEDALNHFELRAAEVRAAHAVEQLLRGAPPPPLAHLERDGLSAVEADSEAEYLIPIYRQRLATWDNPDPPWVTAMIRRAGEIDELRAEKRRAREAEEEARKSAPDDLDDRIREAVVERVADLYRGTWDEEEGYRKGDMVTAAGSLWVARSDAPGRPGDGEGWQLAVKRGRDGKR